MNQIFLIAFSGFSVICSASIAYGQSDMIELFEHENQWGSTNIWLISFHAVTNQPIWKARKEPPLLPGKAINIAKKWIISQGGSKDLWIDDITLSPVFRTSETFSGIYYYNIRFGDAGLVGHYQRCIILMDGTIVKPELLGMKMNHNDPWDFDE
jgi:hypothetical protein